MSVFMVGRRAGTLTARVLFPTGVAHHLSERRTLRRAVSDSGFWRRVGTASGRSRSDPGMCRPGAITGLT